MDYKIIYAKEAWDKAWAWVQAAPGEVAWFGYVTPYDGVMYVEEVFIVPQEADSSGVDFLELGLPFALEKAAREDKLDQLLMCGHSHGTFAVSWSGIDEDMIQKMGTASWFVSTVFNKKGDTKGRLDMFGHPELPGLGQLSLKDVPVDCELDVALLDQAILDIEQYVQKPPPPPQRAPKNTSTHTNHNGKKDEDKEAPVFDASEFATISALAKKEDWAYADDSTGVRYYYNADGVQAVCFLPDDKMVKAA